jgi:prepilin-type N-terminal cleavage/methylation domain-containing protein
MKGERGFTIIEVLIAVLILSVGLLGLVSSGAMVTRMIGEGNRFTEASTVANRRFEIFRSQWTGNNCSGASNGSTTTQGFTVSWTVTSVYTGKAQQVQLTVTSPTARGTRTYTFYRTIPCS